MLTATTLLQSRRPSTNIQAKAAMKKRWRKAVTAKQTPWGEMESPVVRCLGEGGKDLGILCGPHTASAGRTLPRWFSSCFPALLLTWLILANSLNINKASAAAKAKIKFLCTVVRSLLGTLLKGEIKKILAQALLSVFYYCSFLFTKGSKWSLERLGQG